MKLRSSLLLVLAATVCALGGLISPQVAAASVDAVTQWPKMPPIVSNTATGNVSGAFTAGIGNNRLLLVAVATEYTAGNPTISVTYGGTALTNIVAATNVTQLNKIWVGFLPLGTATTTSTATLAVTNTTPSGLVATYVSAAVYSGVDQTPATAISGSTTVAGSLATFTTGNYTVAGINGNNGLGVFISNINGQVLTGSGTATKVRDYAGANMNLAAGAKQVVAGNDIQSVTVGTAAVGVLAAIGLNPASRIATNTTCGDCHGNPPQDTTVALGRNVPPGQFPGAHEKHSGGNANQYSYACTTCHYNAVGNAHSTGFKNISGSKVPRNSYGGVTNIASSNAPAYSQTCTKSTCHSSGRATLQYAASPVWTGTTTCLSCHGGRSATLPNPPARSASNFSLSTSHSQHLKYLTTEINCQMCHGKTAANHTALKDYTGAKYHGNGSKTVNFTNIAFGSMTSYKSPLSGSSGTSKTCNNTACHGGQSRGGWQDTANVTTDHTCAHCHGTAGTTVAAGNADKRLFAPGFRKTGTSTDQLKSSADIRVGSHFKHLSSAYMKNIKCNECHKVPSTPFSTDTNHTLNNLRFNSGTLDFAQSSSARILIGVSSGSTPSQLATFTGYTNGTATKAATCSSVYCHGNRLKNGAAGGTYTKPYWNYSAMINYADKANACGRCHGMPPTSVSGSHSTATLTGANACSNCHGTVMNTDGTFKNKALHINGRVEGGGHAYPYSGSVHDSFASPITNCTTCHTNVSGTYPVARGVKPDCRSCHINSSPGTAGAGGCSSCHGRSTTGGVSGNYSSARPNGGIAGAFPNYSGSHTAHVIKQGLACTGCHNGYGTGSAAHGFSNTSGATYSRTNFKKMAFTVGGSPTYTKATMTCSTLSCHGTAIWGGRLGCIDCHSAAITRTLGRPGKVIQSVTAEFGLAWGHKKSGRATVSDDDCIVCHLEGNGTTHTKTAYHGNGNIDLRDPDGAGETPITNMSNAAWTFQRFSTSYVAGSRTATGHTANTIDNIITQKFCVACHDSNGATNTTARSNNGGTGTATMPFGGISLGANYTVANGAAALNGLVDVKTQLATTNSSFHPVLGPNNNSYVQGARIADPYKVTKTNGTPSNGVVMNCFDCHNVRTTPLLTTRTVAAHGNAVSLRGYPTAHTAGSETAITTAPTASTQASDLCMACHLTYSQGTYYGHNSGSAWSSDTGRSTKGPYIQWGCNMCHSSGYTTIVPRPIRAQDVHGNNALPTTAGTKTGRWNNTSMGTPAVANNKPYAFVRNLNQLADHAPKTIGGTTYSAAQIGCDMRTSPCSQGLKTYLPGGVF